MAPPLGTWLRLLRLAAFTAVAADAEADAACRAARAGRTTLGAAALETLAALPAADVATVRCGELQGTLLHEAVEGGDLEVVKLLLARGGAVNAQDRFLKTPLAWAALKGRVEVTKLLLASNATDVNAKDEFLATPLSDAAQEGHVEVAKLLLQHGAEMEARGQMGRTPLMEAAEQGHLEVADLLIQEGADLDAVDYAGRPPLVHAAIQGEQDMVELLVENGANVFGSSNDGIAFYKSGPPEIQSYIGQQMRFRSLITQPCFLWILLGAPALGVLWAALQRALRGGLPSSFVEIPSERQMVESELLEDTEDDEQSEFFHGAKLLLAQTSLSPFHRFLEVATCAVLIFGFGVSVVWWAFWIPLHVFFYLLPALLAYPCHLLMTRPALFLTFSSLSSAAAPLLQLLRTTLLLALVLLVAARHRSECVWVSSVWAAPICRDQTATAGGATSTSFYVDSLQLSSLNWYELLLDPSTSWQLEGVTLFGFQLRPFLLTAAFFIFLLLTSLAYMATLLLKCFASMTRPCVTDQGLSPSEAVRLQMLLRAAAPSTFPKDVAPEKGRSLHVKLLLLILDVAFDVNTVYTLMFTGNPLFAFALMLVLSRSLAQQLFSGACRLPEAVQESTRRGMMRKDLLDIFDEEQGFQAFASLCLTSLSYWYCIQDAYQATAQIISILLSTYSVSSYLFRRIDAEIET